MDIRLFDAHAKLSFETTKNGVSIKLWEVVNGRDGHGWMLRSGVVLSAAEIQALLATLAAVESDAGA